MELPNPANASDQSAPTEEKTTPVISPPENKTPPVAKTTVKSSDTTTSAVSEVKTTPLPTVNTAPSAGTSILPGTKLTKEEKAILIAAKKASKKQLKLIRRFIVSLIVISAGWFSWLQIDLSKNNTILSIFGVSENLGQKISNIEYEKRRITGENNNSKIEIKNIESKLENKIYTKHATVIQNIRSKQLQWYDELDAEGNQVFGLSDAVPHIQEYFNNRTYISPDSILSGKYTDIQIENIQVSRDGISFSVIGSQILGKIFFLNIEFIEMVNSFPFLKNGKLTQFARQKNEDEYDSMSFSVRLELQENDETDTADERFEEYLTWFNSITK